MQNSRELVEKNPDVSSTMAEHSKPVCYGQGVDWLVDCQAYGVGLKPRVSYFYLPAKNDLFDATTVPRSVSLTSKKHSSKLVVSMSIVLRRKFDKLRNH